MDWGILITVVLQIVGWLIQRSSMSDEAKKKFFDFIKKAAEDLGSVKLHKYGEAQLKWLKENPWKETT